MKAVTKDIMAQVDKTKAQAFVLKMRRDWAAGHCAPSEFPLAVKDCLAHIGINVDLTAGTANAVCTKMERKAGFDIL